MFQVENTNFIYILFSDHDRILKNNKLCTIFLVDTMVICGSIFSVVRSILCIILNLVYNDNNVIIAPCLHKPYEQHISLWRCTPIVDDLNSVNQHCTVSARAAVTVGTTCSRVSGMCQHSTRNIQNYKFRLKSGK